MYKIYIDILSHTYIQFIYILQFVSLTFLFFHAICGGARNLLVFQPRAMAVFNRRQQFQRRISERDCDDWFTGIFFDNRLLGLESIHRVAHPVSDLPEAERFVSLEFFNSGCQFHA